MLNTSKLLYVLPDLTYVAELLPGKKPHTFVIQSFRQINGEFMDENEFIVENINKLFSKLEAEEYQLILPDYLFTNTILTVNQTNDDEIIEQLKTSTLPKLGIKPETHEIDTTVLTQLKGSSKVQISALEKSLLSPIRIAAAQAKVKISAISPVTWTIKSVVSLEPSISVIQIGSHLYAAEHYIGIDQAIVAKVSNVAKVAETIKTLKGAEPNIQTIYLLANNLVEDSLKELLSDVLPVQQLANFREEETKMPSYVKQIIEAGMRTLSISDYPVPRFKLGYPTAEEKETLASGKISSDTNRISNKEENEMTNLPKPNEKEEKQEEEKEEKVEPEVSVESMDEHKENENEQQSAPTQKEIDLAQFANSSSDNKPDDKAKTITKTTPKVKRKNNMMRMIFITIAVFFATVAIGIGIGLAVLNITNSNTDAPEVPVVVTDEKKENQEAEKVEAPEPTATPAAKIDKTTLKVLVVNATTKAGYAGKTKNELIKAGYKKVDAGNAKGDYQEGLYALMAEENKELITALSEDTGLDLVFAEGYETEDTNSNYDAVIVLAK